MNHVIDWLLEEDTPQIKYRTMIELQGRTVSHILEKIIGNFNALL